MGRDTLIFPKQRSSSGSTVTPLVFTVTTRGSVNWSNDSTPVSRPVPLCLKPPHGDAGSRRWWSLIHRMPKVSFEATRCARATSLVQIDAARPKRVPLAMRSASASSSNGITTVTGPNTSSWPISESGSTSYSAVACRKKPSPASVAAWPPASTLAPPVTARSSIARIRARERAEMTGPSCVRGSAGSPTRMDSIFALNFSRKAGDAVARGCARRTRRSAPRR